MSQFTKYATADGIVQLIGMVFIVPLLNLLQINEAYILLGMFANILVENIIRGLASTIWLYYIGKDRIAYW